MMNYKLSKQNGEDVQICKRLRMKKKDDRIFLKDFLGVSKYFMTPHLDTSDNTICEIEIHTPMRFNNATGVVTLTNTRINSQMGFHSHKMLLKLRNIFLCAMKHAEIVLIILSVLFHLRSLSLHFPLDGTNNPDRDR